MKLGTNGRKLARENKAKANATALRLAPIVASIRESGIVTVRAISEELNHRNVASPRGGKWSKATTALLLGRL